MLETSDFFRPMARYTTRFAAHSIIAGLLSVALPAAGSAAETEWVSNEGGAVRIVATPPAPDGTIRAAVEIRLEPGWTTYWMNPGQAGVPPSLDTEGSTNLKSATLRFPPPVALDEGGVRAVGYDGPVAFPVLVRQETPGKPTALNARLFLGVCKDICIPVQATYALDIGTDPARGGKAAIAVAAAFAALPEPPSGDFSLDGAALSDDGKTLRIGVKLPDGSADGAPSLFVAGPSGWFFGEPELTKQGTAHAEFSVAITDGPKGETLTGKDIVAVVTDGRRSMQDSTVVR